MAYKVMRSEIEAIREGSSDCCCNYEWKIQCEGLHLGSYPGNMLSLVEGICDNEPWQGSDWLIDLGKEVISELNEMQCQDEGENIREWVFSDLRFCYRNDQYSDEWITLELEA